MCVCILYIDVCVCIHTLIYKLYTIKYIVAIKRIKLSFAITRLDLEYIMLNETSKIGKGKYHMISYDMWNLRNQTNKQKIKEI